MTGEHARGRRESQGPRALRLILACALASFAGSARAQGDAAYSALASASGTSLRAAILESRPTLNLRLRTEFADIDGFDEGIAYTVRARAGILTGEYRGFQARIEYESTEALGDDRFNGIFVEGDFSKSFVADPDSARFGETYLRYSRENLRLTVGRQRFALGNEVFLGPIDFRQNAQSFDALTFEYQPLPGLELFYSYIYNVNRLQGSQAQRDNSGFDSRSNVLQVAYSPSPLLSLKGYGLLYDFKAGGEDANSTNTYGLLASGRVDAEFGWTFDYRAEYARQTDSAGSPLEYRTDYYNVELGAKTLGIRAAAGREVFGEDNGVGFANTLDTPFLEIFLVTPENGLASNYGKLSFDLPWRGLTEFQFRKFRSVADSDDYGNFFQWLAIVPLRPNLFVLGRLLTVRARDPGPASNVAPLFPPDTLRYSLQIDYRF